MKPKNSFSAKATKDVAPANYPARSQPTHGEISARARQIWERRGRPSGLDESIWLEAERKLLAGAVGAGGNDDADADTRELLGESSGTIEERLGSFGGSSGSRSATSL
jgi:hypothetical protein